MTADKDPWADLADQLGAGGPQTPEPSRSSPPPPPRQRPPAHRDRPQAARSGDWGSVASDLGLETPSDAGRSPAVPSHRESAPIREESSRPPAREGRGGEPRDSAPDRTGAQDVATGRIDGSDRSPREAGEAGEGEGRRRRRRGRRRGRGRRDESRGSEAATRTDREERGPQFQDQNDAFGVAGDRDLDGERMSEEPGRREGQSDSTASGEEGDPPARRRRRGRRGGRRRGRSTRERLADERATAEQPETAQPLEDIDDEPLPTGYGALPRPASKGRNESARSSAGEEGPRRGRRRRRRGGGEPRSATEPRESTTAGGRRSRGGDGSRSGSRSSRGRRHDDFAPVAGRFEEDDEGLEFLGVEEAGRADTSGRGRRPVVDDEVAETGLDTVREVPSWVEAIGIVIAANLDARSRSGGRK